MITTAKNLFFKYKEITLYGIFGVLSTLINIIAYYILAELMSVNYMVSNALAWLIGVFFAYATNKWWVFESRSLGLKELLQEGIAFFSCRFFTGILDMVLMYLFVSIVLMNGLVAKIIVNIIVIIANYIFSKFWIFKGKQTNITSTTTNQ